MFYKTKNKRFSNADKSSNLHSLIINELEEEIRSRLKQYTELTFRSLSFSKRKAVFIFVKNVVKSEAIAEFIIAPLQKVKNMEMNFEKLAETVSIADVSYCNQLEAICEHLIKGYGYLYIEEDPCGVLINVSYTVNRTLAASEKESHIYGPQVSFTESLSTNMNLVHYLIDDPDLKIIPLQIGKRVKKEVKIIYIEGIADDENVQTFKQRIKDIVVDDVQDSSRLAQMLEDNSFSAFPQYLLSELPNRLRIALLKGRIGVLVDQSPNVIIGPVTFFSFFESTGDLYMRWNIGTFSRMLRFLAILFSILLTPAYVAVITFHYEVIPSALLKSLGESRSNVPFPPLFEALLLEFLIELLREAGIRLPTKVGQTIGIVGGIVIGQAAVDAGFTSNILIIITALSALASYTTPSYMMGSSLRLLRFPIILFAGMWGGIGIMFGFCLIIIHLLHTTSLGRPYLIPFYPFRFKDFKYAFYTLPNQFYNNRPITNHPEDPSRFNSQKQNKKKDVDE
ncbi:spore germination protein [Cytobacillus massiliigabonensis]|uniref:spore germination protein n=1 Tax=Cytobacillus massiliigabonensis TaxID=1871011 RepID=UPI000C814CC1|nr:spore germination protein [Cytobacillus massiliigabonensis]